MIYYAGVIYNTFHNAVFLTMQVNRRPSDKRFFILNINLLCLEDVLEWRTDGVMFPLNRKLQ